MHHKILFALALLNGILLTGCGNPEAPPLKVVSAPLLSKEDNRKAQAAFEVLDKICGFSERWSADIDSVELSYQEDTAHWFENQEGPCINSWCEDYGWERHVIVMVKVKEKVTVIPNEFRAWGHNLWYQLGEGSRPGATISKDPSALICGVEPGIGGYSAFLDIPSLAGIGI